MLLDLCIFETMQEEITISAKYYNRLSTVFFISPSSQSNLPSPNLSEWVTTPPTLPFLVSSPLVSVWRMNGGVREVDFLRFSSPCLLVEGDRMVSGWRWCGGWGSDSWGFSSPRSRLGWSGRPDPGGSLPGVALHVWGSGCLFLASFSQ